MDNYKQKIQVFSKKTQNAKETAKNSFDEFCRENYKEELIHLIRKKSKNS